MSLTALPAFANRPRWMFDDGARPIARPGAWLPVVKRLDARCRPSAAILVTRRSVDDAPAERRRVCGPALRTWKTEFR
jgi:hypothetical protein